MVSYGDTIINANIGDAEDGAGQENVKVTLLDSDISGETAQRLIAKLEANEAKNSNEIIDGIIDREAASHKGLYGNYRYDRQGLVKRKVLNQYDLDRQRERVGRLYKRVKAKRLAERDFDEALYFKYV